MDKINWDDPSTWQDAAVTPEQQGVALPETPAPQAARSSAIDWDNPSTWQQPAAPTMQPPEADDGLSVGEMASDAAMAFGMGSGGLASGMGWIADKLGADDVGESLKLIGQSATDYYKQRLSDDAKREMDKEFVTTREGGKWWNPLDWERPEDAAGVYAAFLMGMESLPATMTGMGVGGKIGQGLFKVAEKTGTLRALQKAAEVGQRRAALGATAADDLVKAGKRAEKIINTVGKTTGAIGYGLGEAVPAAGMAGLDVETTIQGMSHEDLWQKSPDHYREAFNSTEGLNMTMDERIAEAKSILADIASSQAGMQAGIATFALGAPAGAMSASLFNKAISKPFATGKIAGTLKEAAGEGVQEFAQSGTEQFVSNLAVKEYADETLDLSRGVINSAVGGAVSGMGMGGFFGAAGTPTKGQQAAAEVSEEARQKLRDDRYKLEEFGARAHASLMTNQGLDKDAALEIINPILERYNETKNVVQAVSDLRHLEKYGRLREKGVDDQAQTFEGIPLTQEAERNGVAYYQIDSSVGADGGRVDAMMPVQPLGTGIYVIQQVKADGSPDEDKVVMGVSTEEEAIATYQRYYRGFDDEQDRNVGGITAMNETEFQDWLKGTTAEHGENIPTPEIVAEQEKERAEVQDQTVQPVQAAGEQAATVLPEVSRGMDAGEQTEAQPVEAGGEDQGERAGVRERVPEAGQAEAGTMPVREQGQPDASQGLQPAAEGDVAVPDVSPAAAPERVKTKGTTVPMAEAEKRVQTAKQKAKKIKETPAIVTDTNVQRAKEAAEKDEGVKGKPLMFSLRREDYQSADMHTAPERGEGAAPAHDLTQDVYPDDIYGDVVRAAQYYGHTGGRDLLDLKAIRAVQKLRGKPNAKVTIYRAVPNDIEEADINPGDWVTMTREYAEQHAERWEGGGKILSKEVTADELFTDGNSIHEWGYQPKTETETPRYSLSPEEKARREKASERMTAFNRENKEKRGHLLRSFMRFDWTKIEADVDAQTAGAMTRDEVQDAIVEWIMKGVESKFFKRWFGKSQTVDYWGTPIRFYHGTGFDIKDFQPSSGFVSLTTNPEFAASFAEGFQLEANRPVVYPLYVRAEKIFDFRNAKMRRSFARWFQAKYGDPNKRQLAQIMGHLPSGDWEIIETPELKEFMKERGYDAFWMMENGTMNLGVFDPRNIKSAVGNVGTFSRQTADLRYSLKSPKTGEVFYSQIERWIQSQMPPRMPVTQAIQAFSSDKALGKKGVRKEEVEDIGLLDWLETLPRKGQVTRDQMLDFVRSSKIDLIEVELRPAALAISKDGAVNRLSDAESQLADLKETIRSAIISAGTTPEQANLYVNDIDTVGIAALDGVLEAPLVAQFQAMLDQAHLDLWQAEYIHNQLMQQEDADRIEVGETKYEAWSLLDDTRPTYRELLLKLPNKRGGASYMTRHWEQSNVLIHMRMHGQFDSETGQTTLVVEEVQSDWHQQGYRYGYSDKGMSPQEMLAAQRETGQAPPAPMEQTWKLVGIKRLIRYAAENGYDSVAWVTGETQRERYALKGAIYSVGLEVDPEMNNSYRLVVGRQEGGSTSKTEWMPKHLLGQQVSEELIDTLFAKQAAGETPVLVGEEVEWEAKGLKSFYDHNLKKLVNKYISKWNSQVSLQEHTVVNAYGKAKTVPLWTFPVTETMREAALQGQPLYSLSNDVAAEIGRRLELYQLRSYIEATTDNKTKPRVMKARLLDGVTRGYYSSQILTHSGALRHTDDRSRMLLQIAERVRGLEVNQRMSLPARVIRQELNRITASWANKPRFAVHDTYHTLPSHIRAELLNWNYTGMMEGVYDPISDTIHLVAENIHSMERLYQSFVEESLGHYGLRQFFGNRFDAFLEEVLPSVEGSDGWNDLMPLYQHIADAIRAGVTEEAKAKAAGRTPNQNVLDNAHRAKLAATEELIAKQAVDQTVWQKFVSWFRNMLRDMGLITNYTENDIRNVMARVHDRIINGDLPHAWGKRNHNPAFQTGALRYSLYGGEDGLLLSKVEEALKNPKMTNRADAARPLVWLNALRGQDAENNWTSEEPARKAAQTWQFSQTELQMTGVVDFLLDMHKSAPNEKVSRDDVLKVFYNTRPKIMAISRGAHFLFPSLPLSDLLEIEEDAVPQETFDKEQARKDWGFFTQRLNDLLNEEGHTRLRRILNDRERDEPLTPARMWGYWLETPFEQEGVPSLADFLSRGISVEEISRMVGVENFNAPLSSTNINPAIKGFIAEQVIRSLNNGSAYRRTMLHYGIRLYGYRSFDGKLSLGYTTDGEGDIDALVLTENTTSPAHQEIVTRLNQKLQMWKEQRATDKDYWEQALPDDGLVPTNEGGFEVRGPTQIEGPRPADISDLVGQVVKQMFAERMDYLRDNQLELHRVSAEDIFPAFPDLGEKIISHMEGSVARRGRTEFVAEPERRSARYAELYSGYTMEGGEALDVISVQMYGGARNRSRGGTPGTMHYDKTMMQDVLHMRVKVRTGPAGERVLAVEEVQSDWASSYRHHPAKHEEYTEWFSGHFSKVLDAAEWAIEEYGMIFGESLEAFFVNGVRRDSVETQNIINSYVGSRADTFASFIRRYSADPINSRTMKMLLETAPESIRQGLEKAQDAFPTQPDFEWMPWVGTYPDLAMNVLVAWARDQGFDGVAWYGEGGDAAALYGTTSRIGRRSNVIRVDMRRLTVWGGGIVDTEARNLDGDQIAVDFPSRAREAKLDANGSGMPYTVDYLADIVKEGGKNAEMAKGAIRIIQTFIEAGGIKNDRLAEFRAAVAAYDGPGQLGYVPDMHALVLVLPEERYWNARLHKLLYEELLVQSAKKISKSSVGKIYLEDTYHYEKRGSRTANQEEEDEERNARYMEVNDDDDRITGLINPARTNTRRYHAMIFGRNGDRLRQWYRQTAHPERLGEDNPFFNTQIDTEAGNRIMQNLIPVTMVLKRATTLMASDADNINPFTGLLQLEYERGGQIKTLEWPIVYETRDDPSYFGMYSGDLSMPRRAGDTERALLLRFMYKMMRDVWGIEKPDPTRFSGREMRTLTENINTALHRFYQQYDSVEVRNAATRGRERMMAMPFVESNQYNIPWEDIQGPLYVDIPLALPSTMTDAAGEDTLRRFMSRTMDSQFTASTVMTGLIPSEDQTLYDEIMSVFNDLPTGLNDIQEQAIPRDYREGLPEWDINEPVVAEEVPEPVPFGPDNPEFSEQIWNYIAIDEAVENKQIFMPFSLRGNAADKKARSIVNAKIAKASSNMTLLDRVTHWLNLLTDYIKTGDMMWGIRQGLLDDAASVKRWEREIFGDVLDASVSPYKMMHLTKNLPSVMAAIAKVGIPQLHEGAFQPVAGRKGFIEIFRPLYEHPDGDLLELWEGYAAARRSTDLLNQQNPDGTQREKLFNRQEVDELLELGNRYPVFQTVFDDWTRFNNDLLNLAVEHGVLSERERDAWAQNDYVPFYRAMEEIEGIDQRTGFGRIRAGVSGQHHGIKRLRGGTQKLGSVVENMWFNTASLIDKVYKNEAMTRVVDMLDGVAMHQIDLPWEAVKVTNAQMARALKQAGLLTGDAEKQIKAMTTQQRMMWNTLFRRVRPTADNVVSVMRNGRLVYYEVEDENLLRTLKGMSAESLTGMMKAMGISKSVLTRMITIDPGFMLANWLRDTLSAWVTSDANFVPVADSIAAMKDVFKEDGTFVKMMMAGAGGGGFYDLTGGNVSKALDEALNRGPTRWLGKAWRGYMKVGAASENSNRLAIANRVMKKGGTAAEAMYQAQDIMNFTMSGDYAAIRFLIRTVPFLNARMQGLYRLGRGAKEHPVGFMLKGAALMAASLALLARNWDDDDYELTEDWMKDTNWNFFVDGIHYTIPKPFEVGLLFATVPERLARLIGGRDDLSVSKEAFWRGIGETLAFNPIPQLFKPMYELGANQNLFTGRPIENLALQRYEYPYRSHPWTSPVAQWVGKLMPDWSGPAQSPARIEHAVRAYTGTIGLYTLNSLDWLVRQVDGDQPEMPDKRWWERPVVSRIVRGPTATTRHNKYEERIYDAITAANQAQNTFNLLARTQRVEDAKRLASERRPMVNTNVNLLTGQPYVEGAVTARSELNKVQTLLREISQKQRTIMYDRNMSGEMKRDLLDELQIQRNATLKSAASLLQTINRLKEELPEEE